MITMSKISALIAGLMLISTLATACGDKSTSQAERDTTSNTDGYPYDDDNYDNTVDDGFDHDPDGNGFYAEDSNPDSMNGIEKIVTGARDAVDGVVSEGADLVDDAVGNDNKTTTATTAATAK